MKKTTISLLFAGGLFIIPSVSEANWLDNFRERIEQRQEQRKQRREKRLTRLTEKTNSFQKYKKQQRKTTSVPELDVNSASVVGALLFGSVFLFSSRRKKKTK